MAVIGVNPVNTKPKASKLEQIAQGLDIAQKVLGVTLAVPQYLQSREATKTQQAAAKLNALDTTVEAQPNEPGSVNVPGVGWRKTNPDIAANKAKELEIKTKELALKDKELSATKIDPFEELIFNTYAKDSKIVPEATKNSVSVSLGGHQYNFEPKEQDKTNAVNSLTESRRKEFLDQSKNFQEVADKYNSVLKFTNNPSPAGDIALLQAYMKIVDPSSKVTGQEIASASNAAGVSTRIRNLYNKVLSGESLTPEQRKDFSGQAGNIYQGYRESHRAREHFYRNLAITEGNDPNRVVPDITLDHVIPSASAPQTKIINGKVYKWVNE